MMPTTWTSEDEALWHAYAAAALTTSRSNWSPEAIVDSVGHVADAMLAAHRKRFPRRTYEPCEPEMPPR